ncbi:hypothetical protein CDC45_19090 (plasmid) [Ralstonia pseudosolanacearum]|uniref:Probable transmembrane protein n=1 Tax=Ralstonia nicotianae (strain ATCC BAA-1114 / GMI1000) TaxID=267608 RepID=Q8XT22_RALN1|nr:hypothetical protein CDC45_19090 [Ralstonia pseudosolanacearum]CAD17444.1 probable transmembrane protein [Ralstonia pseudosolanacearum GMI1000]
MPEGGNRRQAQRFSERKPSGKSQFFCERGWHPLVARPIPQKIGQSRHRIIRDPLSLEECCLLQQSWPACGRDDVSVPERPLPYGSFRFMVGGLFPFFLLSFAVDLICVIRLIMRLSIVGSLCLIAN